MKWVVDTFEPVRRLFFNHTEFQIVGPPSPQGNANGSQWALLAGSVKGAMDRTKHTCTRLALGLSGVSLLAALIYIIFIFMQLTY